MRQESKSHRVRGLSLKVVGLNPKTSKDFSSEICVDNYSPTFFFCLPNSMWQIINLCKSVSTKLQIAQIKEIKKPNVSRKLRNHCITIQSLLEHEAKATSLEKCMAKNKPATD